MSDNKIKKSRVKAAGLKSAFLCGENVLVTSFGKGNKAIPEKNISGNDVKDLNDKNAFDLSVKKEGFCINNVRIGDAVCNNPENCSTSNHDLLYAKSVLEKRYFGKEFPGNNIHIQIEYNIIDIKKILSLYENNIIFSLNNLRNTDEIARENDFLGYFFTGNKYEDMVNNCKGCSFRKNCDYIKRKTDTKICSSYKNFKNYLSQIEPYKAYYSDFFYTYIPDQINEKNKPKLRYEKDIYNIFRILSIVRQSCFHDQNSTRTKIYKIDDFEIVEMLDRLYGQKISDVNKGFCKTNKMNISVLFYIYNVKNDEDKAELVSDFYKYVVIKENKNLGFSVKHLREKLLEDNEFKFLTFQKYDSNRHKLYLLLDYMIYRYYNENQEQLTDFVNQLRATLNDEDKETLYADHAGVIKSAIGHIIIEKLAPKMLGSSISKEGKAFINFNWIENVQLGSSASRFSEIIYIMTMFLDGKEINELLSALISKFENIQSLVEVLKYANLPHSFAEGYEIFEKSGEVAYEIRAIKSFSRMQGKIAGFSKEIFEDAAETLGMRNENTDLSEYIDEHIYSKDKNMRNFIINNVLESNRFLYLVRYNNPKRTKKLVSNMPLVKFVLSRMPESQIERYYSSVINGQDDLSNDKKITALAKKITTMDFEQFENVQQKVKLKSKEAIEKERLKALVGLYLTVAYLITKNLVKINARYSIAISCHERDTQIFEINHMTNPATKEPVQPYITLTEKFIDEGKIRDKGGYITTNKQFITDYLYKQYRNAIAHLTVITSAYKYTNDDAEIRLKNVKSYYQVYQTIMQFCLKNQIKFDSSRDWWKNTNVNDMVSKLLYAVEKTGTYSKTLTRILNTPFAYNVARYKNLSYETLFDKESNETSEKKD